MIQQVTINKSFSNFLNKHEKIIFKLFDKVKSFKKNIPNTYKYSLKYSPPRKIYKYTDKLFIGCILYIALNNYSWTSFIGPIPGKQVHKKFKEYCKKGLFKSLFKNSIKEYLCTNAMEKTQIISIDSTTIFNKNCNEIESRNPYYKNKKCAKITAIVDAIGTPINLSVDDGIKHDSKLFNAVFNDTINNNEIRKNFNKTTTILADKGYDSKAIRSKIKESKMKCIIAHNKRNCKDKSKIKSLTNKEKNIYKNRVKVEHFFGIIKKYPKINCIYEKSLQSYLNLVLLVSSMILINRTDIT